MKNIVLNAGHQNSNFFFSSEKNDRIFLKEKSYIDLSKCSCDKIFKNYKKF
jgi:hypothetical protein